MPTPIQMAMATPVMICADRMASADTVSRIIDDFCTPRGEAGVTQDRAGCVGSDQAALLFLGFGRAIIFFGFAAFSATGASSSGPAGATGLRPSPMLRASADRRSA